MNKRPEYPQEGNVFQRHDERDEDDAAHKREVRKMLEERMERKRLKDELEDFEGELEDDFDWDDVG